MTELQQLRAKALANVSIAHGATVSRSFIADMSAIANTHPEQKLSERQANFLAKLCWIYRKQIPATLVPAQDPDTLTATHVTEGLEDSDTEQTAAPQRRGAPGLRQDDLFSAPQRLRG